MLIAVGSLKGSPGVSVFCLALAAYWPASATDPGRERWPVVVECDPAGGDLAARYALALSPGLLSLAAATRRGRAPEPSELWSHVQRLPGGLPVLVAPPGAARARAAVTRLNAAGGSGHWLAGAEVVIADCGRLDPDSAALPVVAAADRMLLLARPRADELAHLASRLPEIDGWPAPTGVLLAGAGYSTAEVAREVGVAVMGRIPADPAAAAALTGQAPPRRTWRRRGGLAEAAASVASALVTSRRQQTTPPDPAVAPPGPDQQAQLRAGPPATNTELEDAGIRGGDPRPVSDRTQARGRR